MTQLQTLVVKSGAHTQQFNGTWYRGANTNFIPSKPMLAEEGAVERHILAGWLPDSPFITKDTRITAFGSCFAAHISKWLAGNGYRVNGEGLDLNAHIIRFGEGMVNTFAIREQIEWALEGKSLEEGLWFGEHKEIVLPTEDVRLATRELLLGTEALVITLGLSEIWYDKRSGRAFWRAVPASLFDESRHGFRVSSVLENLDNLAAIHALVRKHMPRARLIFTLSPIPLMATFRPISCLTANSVSKAILRVAIDELMRQSPQGLHYFPSYEIVKELFDSPYLDDNRHVKPEVVQFIMRTFAKHYCGTVH